MYWLPILATIVNLLVLIFMPKRMSKQEIYITWSMLAGLTLYVDVNLSLVFDLYGFIAPGAQFSVATFKIIVTPLFGVIFLNFMPESKRKFWLYVIGCVLLSLLFEWLAVRVHYMYYVKWKLWYSAPIYFAIFIFLRWHLYFVRSNSK